MGIQKRIATWNQFQFSIQLNTHHMTQNSTSRKLAKRHEETVYTKMYNRILIAALCKIGKKKKIPGHNQNVHRLQNGKLWYIHTMEH